MWKFVDQRGDVVPDHVDHRGDIGLRNREVLFPVWIALVKIRNWFVTAIAQLLEEWDVASERSLDEILVIATHGNNEISLTQQLAGDATLNVPGDVGALLTKTVPNPLVYLLRLSLNAGRTDAIERRLTE